MHFYFHASNNKQDLEQINRELREGLEDIECATLSKYPLYITDDASKVFNTYGTSCVGIAFENDTMPLPRSFVGSTGLSNKTSNNMREYIIQNDNDLRMVLKEAKRVAQSNAANIETYCRDQGIRLSDQRKIGSSLKR